MGSSSTEKSRAAASWAASLVTVEPPRTQRAIGLGQELAAGLFLATSEESCVLSLKLRLCGGYPPAQRSAGSPHLQWDERYIIVGIDF